MGRVSKNEAKEFEVKVISAINTEYNKGMIGKIISRQEIKKIEELYNIERDPYFLRSDKVERGRYDISKYLYKNKTKQKSESVEIEAIAQVTPISIKKQEASTLSVSIPEKDPTFVKFGNYKDLKSIVASGIFFPTFIYGPTGNGKTMMVEQIHAELNKPLIRVNMTATVDEDQLIGTKTLSNGNIEIIEGPVLIAMRTGSTILIDEIDASNENAILCLQSILEGGKSGKSYYFKLKNEIVQPKPGFNIIATANTKGQGSEDGRYVGTRVLNEAFLERFVGTLIQEYPPEKVEKDIASNLMKDYGCYDENVLSDLIKWVMAIRITYEDGGCNDLITTRRVGHIIKTYSVFRDINKAVKFCVNRFDSGTAEAFINLFDKISVGDNSQISTD